MASPELHHPPAPPKRKGQGLKKGCLSQMHLIILLPSLEGARVLRQEGVLMSPRNFWGSSNACPATPLRGVLLQFCRCHSEGGARDLMCRLQAPLTAQQQGPTCM